MLVGWDCDVVHRLQRASRGTALAGMERGEEPRLTSPGILEVQGEACFSAETVHHTQKLKWA